MVSVDAHSSPQQVLQVPKRAHDSEALLVHGHLQLLRATKDAAQKPKWLIAYFFHHDATLKLSLWDLRQKTSAMAVGSTGNISISYPSFGCNKETALATRSFHCSTQPLLALPCFLCDCPIRRDSLGPVLNPPHVLLQQHSKGLDNLSQPRERRPQPVYGLQKLHQLTRRLRAAHARQSIQTLPVIRHLSPRVHHATPRDLGIEEQTLVSSGENTSFLQTTKDLIESVSKSSSSAPHHTMSSI